MIDNVTSTSTSTSSTASTGTFVRVTPFGNVTLPIAFETLFDEATTAADTTSDSTSTTSAATTTDDTSTTATASTAGTTTDASATTAAASSTSSTSQPATGIAALVSAIMNGTLVATHETDASKLVETDPTGTTHMPSVYYASDETADQIAELLGGKVVQMTAFGEVKGWTEPEANFIELPDGQTVNAADLEYYANCADQGVTQLTADLTACINEGDALTKFYQDGGEMPSFSQGYVGPAISGEAYPSGTLNADGTVVNPLTHTTNT